MKETFKKLFLLFAGLFSISISLEAANPPAPDIIVATVMNSDSIEVVFDSSNATNIKEYEIFYSTNNGSFVSAGKLPRAAVQPLSFYHDGINPIKNEYCYYVVAIDSNNLTSTPSDTHCVVNLKVNGGNLQNLLYWNSYQGFGSIDQYFIFIWDGSTWQILDSLESHTLAYTHDSIPCNVPQKYLLQAVNSDRTILTTSDSAAATPYDATKPDAPKVRYVTTVSNNRIDVVFDTSVATDVTTYIIYTKTGNSPFRKAGTVSHTNQNPMTFSHTGISAGDSSYCYYVSAVDACAGNESDQDTVHCAVNISGTAGNLQNNLSWNHYTGFGDSVYIIQRLINNTWTTLDTVDVTTYSDISGLSCDVSYSYRIISIDTPGTTNSISDTVILTPFDNISPSAPQLRYASVMENDDVMIEWDWDMNSDQKFFEIYRTNNQGFFYLLDTVIYDSIYIDNSASPDVLAHKYYIVAIDSCSGGNRSLPSDTHTISIPSVTTGGCVGKARLSWTDYSDLPQGVDYYHLWRSENNGSYSLITSGNQVYGNKYVDSPLNVNSNYCYRIEAVDVETGYSAFTSPICMQPVVMQTSNTPDAIMATVVTSSTTNGEVLFQWDNKFPKLPAIDSGYYVISSTDGIKFDTIAIISNLNTDEYSDLQVNTEDYPRYYYVTVFNKCLTAGEPSDTHRTVDLSGVAGNLQVDLSWTPYIGFPVDTYAINRKEPTGNWTRIGYVGGNQTTYTDNQVDCNIKYSYRIVAFSPDKNLFSRSDTVQLTPFDTVIPGTPKIRYGTIGKTGTTDGEISVLIDGVTKHNLEGYVVYKSFNNGGFSEQGIFLNTNPGVLTYTETKENTSGIVHGYYFRARDKCGNLSPPSDTHFVVNLNVKAQNGLNTLNWYHYRGWQNWLYQIQRKRRSTNWRTLTTVSSTVDAYVDNKVHCDTFYSYRVIAINQSTGYQSFSNIGTVQSFNTNPPAPVSLYRVTTTQSGNSDGVILVQWHSSNEFDLKNYVVMRSENGLDWDTIAKINVGLAGNDTFYFDSSRNTNNVTYYYRVGTQDSCGNINSTFNPFHKSFLISAKGGNQQIRLNWTPYIGFEVDEYRLYKNGALLKVLDGEKLTFLDTQVICKEKYGYVVEAISGQKNSFSNVDTATATDSRPPAAVYLKSVSVTEPNGEIMIEWERTENFDAMKYSLFRQIVGDRVDVKLKDITDLDVTYFEDSLDVSENPACYFIEVHDYCGNKSKLSNDGCTIKLDGDPKELSNEIFWKRYQSWDQGVNYHNVYKSVDSGETWFWLGTTNGNVFNFVDRDLREEVPEYCYRIEAVELDTVQPVSPSKSYSTMFCMRQRPLVHIPTAFTPTTSFELNDVFEPDGIYISGFEMTIMDRWGEVIYQNFDSKGWDGKDRAGNYAPSGNYIYLIYVKGINKKTYRYEGSITIPR